MTTINKTPRIGAAIKEFNIGKDTLVEFLTNKGFEINASNPNAKLSEEMYDALQGEFAKDKLAKRKSDEIALPKGSLLDGLNKSKEDLDISVRDKKEEEPAALPIKESVPAKKTVPEPIKEEPIQAPVPAEPVKEEPTEIPEPPTEAASPAEKPEEAAEPEIPAVQPKMAPQEQEQPEEEDGEEEPEETPLPQPEETPDVSDMAEPEEAPTDEKHDTPDANKDEQPQHIELKAKLKGPKIIDKINLDELNLSSRPSKTTPAKKKADTKTTKKTATPADKTKPVKKTAAPVAATTPKEQPKTPPVPVATEKTWAPTAPVINNAPLPEEKPEHIEMKAPRLEGPKIIGKIDLPKPASQSGDSLEKRTRKRIPLTKKPENNKSAGTNMPQQKQGDRPPYGSDRNKPQQGGGYQQRNDRNQQQRGGQQQGGYNRNNKGGGDRFQRGGYTVPTGQEIDTKAIQDKIRETQAKLSGNTKGKNQKAKYRRDKREMMAEKRAAAEQAERDQAIQVTEFISVSELAGLLDVGFADVISKCMSLGIMASINQRLDAEVIELVAAEFGYNVEFINLEQKAELEDLDEDADEDLEPRAPIVTIMGHVDHGKTSLLDYIRSANVVAGEAGGITQHIGAYKVVSATGKQITFLDTPGHEAFTAMRARGAKVADIAVIVIAADDAIMPQTKEAISHAQAANLPMIFAINKIDKEGANPEKIKEQLAHLNILVEDWGGKFQSQEISAKSGLHVDLLLEKIGLEAEMLELKANPNRTAAGSVIEASLDKGRGYVATMLVQNGTLEQGDMLVSGQYFGKIKAMFNERGQRVSEAGPSTPVQVLGLNGAPQAGEKFRVYEDEDEAKEVAGHRSQILREQGIRARKHITLDEIGRRLALGNFKELSVIIKGDFDGSVEALSDSLQKLSTEEVAVNVVHKGVGQITESDVNLANASDAILIGFQVRPSVQAARLAEQENIEIRTYSIIYDAIEEIKSAMEGLLEPKLEKKTVCNVEVRETWKMSGIGTIAGCYVLDGKITRNTKVNIIRDGIVVYSGELGSLKRFKDDVKEVNAGYECGLIVKNYNDVHVNDIIEGYEEVEVKRTL